MFQLQAPGLRRRRLRTLNPRYLPHPDRRGRWDRKERRAFSRLKQWAFSRLTQWAFSRLKQCLSLIRRLSVGAARQGGLSSVWKSAFVLWHTAYQSERRAFLRLHQCLSFSDTLPSLRGRVAKQCLCSLTHCLFFSDTLRFRRGRVEDARASCWRFDSDAPGKEQPNWGQSVIRFFIRLSLDSHSIITAADQSTLRMICAYLEVFTTIFEMHLWNISGQANVVTVCTISSSNWAWRTRWAHHRCSARLWQSQCVHVHVIIT